MKRKTCFKCNIEKPLTHFYKHKQMGDGYLNKCKECNKKDVRKNRAEKIDYYREYDKRRANLPHRAEARADYVKTENGKKAVRKASLRYIEKKPIQRAANIILGNAVKYGKIIKPKNCEECGSEPKILHGHHDDYAFPLSVRWLCPGCHSYWHKHNTPKNIGGETSK